MNTPPEDPSFETSTSSQTARRKAKLASGLPLPIFDEQCMAFLIDDQVMVAEAVRRALSPEPDINFHYCADFVNAVALASQMRPTVILQDLVMPGVDGIAMVRDFRADPVMRETPIIVLSSKEDPRVKRAAFEAGANDYLVKLPDNIELIARIRYHSKAYLSRLQRDAAYTALQDSQRQLAERVLELEEALAHVKMLQGLLPICCYCKKIRDTDDYWHELEAYIKNRADVHFSHGICPECYEKQIAELTGESPGAPGHSE